MTMTKKKQFIFGTLYQMIKVVAIVIWDVIKAHGTAGLIDLESEDKLLRGPRYFTPK